MKKIRNKINFLKNNKKISFYEKVFKSIFSVCLVFSVLLCAEVSASGKAHTPMVAHIQRLPPGGSSRRSRVRESALQ